MLDFWIQTDPLPIVAAKLKIVNISLTPQRGCPHLVDALQIFHQQQMYQQAMADIASFLYMPFNGADRSNYNYEQGRQDYLNYLRKEDVGIRPWRR